MSQDSNDTDRMNQDNAHLAQTTGHDMSDVVGAKEERKLLARKERAHSIWFGLGMMGIVGWSVAIPTLLGIALGSWLDVVAPANFSWKLTGLVGGVVLGCWNAWFWVKRQSESGE